MNNLIILSVIIQFNFILFLSLYLLLIFFMRLMLKLSKKCHSISDGVDYIVYLSSLIMLGSIIIFYLS